MTTEPEHDQKISFETNRKLMDDLFFSLRTIQREIAYGIDRLKSNLEFKELLSTLKDKDDDIALKKHRISVDVSTRWLQSRTYHQIHQLDQTYNELMINSEFASATSGRKIIKKPEPEPDVAT